MSVVLLTGNTQVQVDKENAFNQLGVIKEQRGSCVLVVVDSVPSGFRELKQLIDKPENKGKRFFRSLVPFSGSWKTPAEFLLSKETDYSKINGRARDEDPTTLKFEEVKGPFDICELEADQWPFPHSSSYRDVVGNALFGDRITKFPFLVSGFTAPQEFILEWQTRLSPHELSVLVAAKFDYKSARGQLMQLRGDPACQNGGPIEDPALPPRLPVGFSKPKAAELVLSVCYREEIEEQRTKLPDRWSNSPFILPGGKLSPPLQWTGDYITQWTKAKFLQFRHKYSQLNNKQNPFEVVKDDLIQKIVYRVIFKETGLGFLDMPREAQRVYLLARLQQNERDVQRLLDLPLHSISKDYLSFQFSNVRVDTRDAIDLFAEHVVMQVGIFHQITPSNLKKPPVSPDSSDNEEDQGTTKRRDSSSSSEEEQQQAKKKFYGKRRE